MDNGKWIEDSENCFSLSIILYPLILLLIACTPIEQSVVGEVVTVQYVVDGDTIHTDLGRVRLVGIDAPERGDCGYTEATHRLRELVHQKEIVMIADSLQDDRDQYGRLLRFIEIDQADIGAKLLEEGYVRVFSLDRFIAIGQLQTD